MIPIGDRNPTRGFVFVNNLLLLANIGVFLYELSLGARLDDFIATWGVRPDPPFVKFFYGVS